MRSSTRFAMLDGWPSQMGVPMTRMSLARTRARIVGQASPGPSSEVTPGFTSWSATRIVSPDTPCLAKSARQSSRSLWVEEGLSPLLRVQLRARARSDMRRLRP